MNETNWVQLLTVIALAGVGFYVAHLAAHGWKVAEG